MDLTQHLNASIKSASFQAGKKDNFNWPGVGCFLFAQFILPKCFILDIAQRNTSSKFHSVFVSFILHPCIKLMTNKLQPLSCKVPEKFRVECRDYLIVLALHGTFISHVCLFKICVTVAWINWPVFQTKLKLNLMQYYVFSKNRCMWYMTLNENLMNYSLSSWMWFSMYLC